MPIEVNKLTHVYMPDTPFEMRALHEVSLKIEDGEFIGIIGHTGSGKSTLISHLNALERALGALEHAAEAAELDCVATDIRGALHALGEITGTDVDAAVIDRIFARLCVGK